MTAVRWADAKWFAVGVACWALFGPCRAAGLVEVGLIESFDAAPDHYVLRRGEEQTIVPIQPGGRLMRGDRVEVKSEGDRLTIWLFEPGPAKKSVIVLSRNSGPYVVDGNPPEKGLSQQLSGIWQWAARELGLREVEEREKTTAEASIRDPGGFAVPLLKDAQILGAGRRAITIAWPGADSPARIEITGPAGGLIATGDSSSGNWTSNPIDLEPGLYRIAIAPKVGPGIEKTVEVIPARSLPKFPDDPAAAQLPPELVDTIRATWLAGRGRRFVLESYQIVAPIAQRYHPAKLLSQALIEGSVPAKPR